MPILTTQPAGRTPAPLAATRFLAGVTISWYGDWLTTVGLVVVLYNLSGTAVAPAGYVLARVAPRLLGPIWGGDLADRHPAAVVAATLCALQSVSMVGLIIATRVASIPAIYVAVIVSQFLGSMVRPCHAAMFPSVASPDHVRRLNTLYSASLSSAMFVAPAIGALVLQGFGVTALFQADLLSFALAGVLFITLPRAPHRGPSPLPHRPWTGLVTAWREPVLRAIVILFACDAALVTLVQAVLVVAAAERFGGSEQVGFLYAAVGAGGLLGVTMVFIWHPPPGRERSALFAAATAAVATTVALGVVPNEALAVAVLFLNGSLGTLYQTWGTSYLQEHVSADLLGRISGAVTLASYAGMVAGALAALALVVPIGWSRLIVWAGVLTFAAVLAAWRQPTGPATGGVDTGPAADSA